jgi:hypothetical protein
MRITQGKSHDPEAEGPECPVCQKEINPNYGWKHKERCSSKPTEEQKRLIDAKWHKWLDQKRTGKKLKTAEGYTCGYCGHWFRYPCELGKHLEISHGFSVLSDERLTELTCDMCGHVFSNVCNRKDHEWTAHNNGRPPKRPIAGAKCRECPGLQSFNTKQSLKRHQHSQIHKRVITEILRVKEKAVNCSIKTTLDFDTEARLNTKLKRCNVCDKNFSRHEKLVGHLDSKKHQKKMKPRPIPVRLERNLESFGLDDALIEKQSDEPRVPCYCGQLTLEHLVEGHLRSKRHLKATGKYNERTYKDENRSRKKPEGTKHPGHKLKCSWCGEFILKRQFKEHFLSHEQPPDLWDSIKELAISLKKKDEAVQKKIVEEAKKKAEAQAKGISIPVKPKAFSLVKDFNGTGRANSSPIKFTCSGFQNFLSWRQGAGNIDPEATNVGDVLKRSKAGPMKVGFAQPLPKKKKAFEGWADATDRRYKVIS